jgi:hypothetical protein
VRGRGPPREFASAEAFRDTMRGVLRDVDSYRPRKYFERSWDTVAIIEGYLAFFQEMG